jgi:hypothetical protein
MHHPTWCRVCVPTPLGSPVQFHFLENWFDTRDLGAVPDHEEPLPHPVEDRQQ